jgi:hypothetical protein
MSDEMHDLIMSGSRIGLDKPGDPLDSVAVAQKLTKWLRERTEGHEPTVKACMYTAAWIDVLCAHIEKLEEDIDDLHRQRDYETSIT